MAVEIRTQTVEAISPKQNAETSREGVSLVKGENRFYQNFTNEQLDLILWQRQHPLEHAPKEIGPKLNLIDTKKKI